MTCKVIKVAAAVSAVVCLGTASAQQTISVNIGRQGTSVAAKEESGTVKVQGRGVGTTKVAALKDAYRDAIERAVGLYVDAETVANNDQVVTDQVLTHSNAYITDYRELGETRLDGGLVQLRILATVKKQALTTKLTDVMPAQTVRIDDTGLQNAHAQLVTKEKRAEDAAALLKNALDGLNPMQLLMVASIRPETQKIITADDFNNDRRGDRREAQLKSNQVMLRYLFEVKLDREKYFKEFMPNLKKVLDQISITKPKEIRLMELMPRSDDRAFRERSEYLQKYLATGESESYSSDSNRGYYAFGSVSSTSFYMDPVHCYSISWQGEVWYWPLFGNSDYHYDHRRSWKTVDLTFQGFRKDWIKDKVYFALITSLNADCSNGKVTMYELDKSVVAVLSDWRKGLIDKDKKNDGRGEQKTTNYNIVLLDKDGEEIGVYPWQIQNGILMNVNFGIDNKWNVSVCMMYATPFVGCFGESMIQWRDFILEKDKLSKIASIKIEPVE